MLVKTKRDFYWLSKLHKQSYKARFIASFIKIASLLSSLIKYWEKVYERSGKNLFCFGPSKINVRC